ncbi:MAG: flagellar biosynthetic protein FliO [Burkholderiaceae bacterium]
MQSVWPSMLVFLLVIAAIPATVWLLRRGQSLGARGNASLGIAGAVAVGPRERIALVRADGKWLVVGITPQAITLLTELDGPPAQAPAVAGAAPGFPDLLRSLARRHADRA